MKKHSRSEIAELKYRPLKKSLRVFYKKIKAALEQDTLPDPKVLHEFMALSQIMTSYPGFGDAQYDNFTGACLAFQKACKSNDLQQAQKQLSSIMQIKHNCHHRAKKQD